MRRPSSALHTSGMQVLTGCTLALTAFSWQNRYITSEANSSKIGVQASKGSVPTVTTPKRLPPRMVPTWASPINRKGEMALNKKDLPKDKPPPYQTESGSSTKDETAKRPETDEVHHTSEDQSLSKGEKETVPHDSTKAAQEQISNQVDESDTSSPYSSHTATAKTLEMTALADAIGEEIKSAEASTPISSSEKGGTIPVSETESLSPKQVAKYVEEAFTERARLAAERESFREQLRNGDSVTWEGNQDGSPEAEQAGQQSSGSKPPSTSSSNTEPPTVIVKSSETRRATIKISSEEVEKAEAAVAAAKEADRKRQQAEDERRASREGHKHNEQPVKDEKQQEQHATFTSPSVQASPPTSSFTPKELEEQQQIALQITRNKMYKALMADSLGLDLGQLLSRNVSAAAKAVAAATKREREHKQKQAETSPTSFSLPQAASTIPSLVGQLGTTNQFVEEQTAVRLHQYGGTDAPLAVTLVTPTAWGAATSEATFYASAAAAATHPQPATITSDEVYVDPITKKIHLPPKPIKVPQKLLVKQLRGSNPDNINRLTDPHAKKGNSAPILKSVSNSNNGYPYKNSTRQLSLGMGGYPLSSKLTSATISDKQDSIIDAIHNNPYYQPNLVDDVYSSTSLGAYGEDTAVPPSEITASSDGPAPEERTPVADSATTIGEHHDPSANPHCNHNYVDWIDVQSHPTATLQEYLSSIASFMVDLDVHESLVQTTLDNVVLPQYSLADGCYALVLRSVVEELTASTELDTIQELTNRMTIIAMPAIGRVITVHRAAMPFVDEIISSWADDHAPQATVSYITSLITQETVRTYHRAISESIVQFDGYEARLFIPQKQRAILAREIYHIKRRASVFSRSLQLIQESFTNMSAGLGIQSFERSYQEVQQELIHVRSLSEELGDNATTVLALLFQLSSYQLNGLMRVLTLFSAFFIPLTFIASVCGMGFDVIGFGLIGTQDDGRPLYKFVIRDQNGWNTNLVALSMVGSAGGLLLSFRMKGLF